MPKQNHSNRTRNPDEYNELRDKGMSEETAARISDSNNSGRQGDIPGKYARWSKEDLFDKAEDLDIEGRSEMNKEELIAALRDRS